MNANAINARPADTLVVLDFETTGLSPAMGDRAIEIGAVLIEQGRITDRFQRLMNPSQRISAFIEGYTGISNAMVRDAGSCEAVMTEFADFIADHNLVAHNASFDKKFLDAELASAGADYRGSFACSMLIARRLYPHALNHKLGTLVNYHQLPNDGVFHRALADAEMTAHLWLQMLEDLHNQHGVAQVPFSLMKTLARTPKAKVSSFLEKQRDKV